MERFQWLTTEEAQEAVIDPHEKAAVAEELADLIIYRLSLSNVLDLDASTAILGKLETNEHRYPTDEFQGHFRRRRGSTRPEHMQRRRCLGPERRRAKRGTVSCAPPFVLKRRGLSCQIVGRNPSPIARRIVVGSACGLTGRSRSGIRQATTFEEGKI
jgi:hypothetical protein